MRLTATGMVQFITTLNHTHILLHSESQTCLNIVRCFTALTITFSLTTLSCLAPTNRPPTISYALHARFVPQKYFAVTIRDFVDITTRLSVHTHRS